MIAIVEISICSGMPAVSTSAIRMRDVPAFHCGGLQSGSCDGEKHIPNGSVIARFPCIPAYPFRGAPGRALLLQVIRKGFACIWIGGNLFFLDVFRSCLNRLQTGDF